MKRTWPIFLTYSILLTICTIVYYINIHGPSVALLLMFTATTYFETYDSYVDEKNNTGEKLTRRSATLIAALSPGIYGFFEIFKNSKKMSDFFISLFLFLGFFTPILFLGSAFFIGWGSQIESSLGLTLVVVSIISILFSYDISVTWVNGYCDKLGLPYGEGRFEIEHKNPKKDMKLSFSIYLTLIIVAFTIFILWNVFDPNK